MKNNHIIERIGNAILLLFLFFNVACNDLLEVEDPIDQIPTNVVFEDEATATAAITSLYSKLRDDTLLTGSYGISISMSLYSDELEYYGFPGAPMEMLYNHLVIASNDEVRTLWVNSYKLIYMCNAAIEGLENSQTLAGDTKEQLLGEALFIRALSHFYLVNLFGDVPYITTTDYAVNRTVSRTDAEEVYEFMISDLVNAKSKLTSEYISGERIRANRYVVSALLARIYLYRQEWSKAEAESSEIVDNSAIFHLEADLNNEFLLNSSSAILQLKPKLSVENTKEAGVLLFEWGPPLNASLQTDFVDSFEAGDLRRTNWIKDVTDEAETWYSPYKYKAYEYTGSPTVEYSIVLRTAEQYLIRAEARTHTGNLDGARQDINTIRNRAGLPDTGAVSQNEILMAILNERKFELFTEQGHRWFDLKRMNLAGEVLAPVKLNWKPTDILFPIPEAELIANPNLLPQNPGY